MIRWCVAIILLPLGVLAEPVTIRTGEHDTFSRFVIAIGEGTGWSLQDTEGGYLLVLTGRNDGFSLDTVFDRIPRDRVVEVTQRAPDRLFLAVQCDCSADAFLWRPDQLVVDVTDNSDLDVPSDVPTQQTQARTTDITQGAPLRLPSIFSEPPQVVLYDAPPPVSAESGLSSQSTDIAATESALIEGLARAASQGFLDAAVPDTVVPENNAPAADTNVIEDAPTTPPVPQQPGIGITTALDRDLAFIRNIIGYDIGQQCLPADLFEIATWGDERSFHVQAASMAEALAGEFGEQPREAQEALARLYLHFGFGAEARAVLAVDPARSQNRKVLMQLAGVIDDYQEDYSLLAAQAGCDTHGALWAFFVNPIDVEDSAKNQILQSFFTLPQPLRGQIAPRLARRFISVGEADAAERLLRATDNNDTAATHETASTRALIAEEMNDPDEAITVLSQEAHDNARTTPASLIRLIELSIENNNQIQETDLVLAAAMRQEHRGTQIETDLAIAEAAGRTQLGNYQAALDVLRDREGAAAVAALNDTVAHITEHGTPADFLGFAFGDMPAGLTPHSENLIAQRLIDIGFPERATTLLSGPAQRAAAAERRYLRASAAIGTDNFAEAIDALLGFTDPRANALRSQAYAGLGEHRAALSALAPDDLGRDSSTLQFRAGAWERLTVEDDTVLSSFAQSVVAQPDAGPTTTLADRRALLAQSQESRQAVEGLLLRFDGITPQD